MFVFSEKHFFKPKEMKLSKQFNSNAMVVHGSISANFHISSVHKGVFLNYII